MQKLTAPDIRSHKTCHGNPPLTMVTAYDAASARIADKAGVDIILVGDSLAMVVQGRADTLRVTVDEIAYHTAAVARVNPSAHVVSDMPWMSYHTSRDSAIRNAAELIRSGAQSVKIECGRYSLQTPHTTQTPHTADTYTAQTAHTTDAHAAQRDSRLRKHSRLHVLDSIITADIPVMAHIGLTPQSLHALGGFKVQGQTETAANELVKSAQALENVGCYAIVIECVPPHVAEMVTNSVRIPTIGIGAGIHCDGQVLVYHDILGLEPGKTPKFVRRYEDMYTQSVEAVKRFASDVRSGDFPSGEETYS